VVDVLAPKADGVVLDPKAELPNAGLTPPPNAPVLDPLLAPKLDVGVADAPNAGAGVEGAPKAVVPAGFAPKAEAPNAAVPVELVPPNAPVLAPPKAPLLDPEPNAPPPPNAEGFVAPDPNDDEPNPDPLAACPKAAG